MKRSYAALAALFATLNLSACNSSDGVLASASGTPSAPLSTTPGGMAMPSPTGPQVPAHSRIPLNKVRLQVAPIVGAPVEAVAPMTKQLHARLNERGITLVSSTDKTTTHILKGYFSAITESGTTTVIYVWDVYDPAGNRLHRISGQQKALTDGKVEGWAAVSAATMRAIADATVEQFSVWMTGKVG
ncbi:hypothetical protein [Manganibacter manganicus]|uniref:Lipoprotein n=1 Tax=Manganibacter manganicus TaxID=1873176 RepID=A0A1V8RUJ3_9HYPH|nr:hypothetical protein [Pseudaminobacter manganicus]OQM76867.1 hypothetical protein BFN67_11755 [Pseudaminobacter manganicus]